jgi:hypothetical protein
MKRITLFLAILSSSTASACMWDSDTLAEEAANKMDLVRIITGRFIRNPPLYYQMRLDRVSKELEKDPSNLDNYDNASVACDRLGNDEDAIKWIDKKRNYMLAHSLTPITNKDDWYRYYANAGTFHAHLWFRQGAKPSAMKEIEQGRDLIAKALEINPESHFGRERVQLEMLKWLAGGATDSLANHFELVSDGHMGLPAQKDAKGLAGLVMLGNGWESVDLFLALQDRLSMAGDSSLAELAMLRAKELLAKGVKPMVEVKDNSFFYPNTEPADNLAAFNEKEFQRLRSEADAWHAKRTEFMLIRLKTGRHPDTDPQFWDGFAETPAPTVRSQPYLTTPRAGFVLMEIAFFSVLALIIGLPTFFIVRAVRRARRKARSVM